MTSVLARLEGIERSFGPVRALAGADLTLHAGEVHGVLGANGAGKTTLFHVLAGMVRPDAGSIDVRGVRVSLSGPRDAWAHGIGLVHQHFTLVPALTVTENLALGLRGAARRSVVADARRVMEDTGLRVPLEPVVASLGVGDRQRIEILKALLRDPPILALDEPTAVLTPDETRGLFSLLRALAREGRAVALVAHKLDEVLGVADRITVLRSGRTVLTGARGEHDEAAIVRAMVGSAPHDPIAVGATASLGGPPPSGVPGGPSGLDGPSARGARSSAAGRAATAVPLAALRDVHLSVDGAPALRGVDLTVSRGEVVGVAGVEGNGQRELSLVLAGRIVPDRGGVTLPEGIGFVPQDRSREGIVPDFDLTENVALAYHRDPRYGRGPRLRWDELRRAAEELRTRYDVAAPSVDVAVGTLSGGNQQRVVVGRELAMATEMLVAENPTRGLDIAATAFVHDRLRELRALGVAIVLVSTDLDEVIALSDRVFAIARGRLVEIPPGERTVEGVGARMLGGGMHGAAEPDAPKETDA